MSGERISTISPSTNLSVVERNAPSDSELEEILRKSSEAFKGFPRSFNLEQRQSIVQKALGLLEAKKDVLAHELTEQMGRPISYTSKEISTAILRSQYLLKISKDCLSDTPGEAEPGFKRYIHKEPVGPVLIVFAWNYPYLILVNSLIPAILAGNTVILKPSPQTPTIAEHVHSIFLEAGLPADVVSFFHSGSMALLQSAVRSPFVKLVCFTGSVQGGLTIQAAASERVLPVSLELGGKDAAYVRPDVDLDWVAEELVDGAVFNSGQSCCSVERIYVHDSIHNDFIASTQKVLRGYKLGDPFDPTTHVGPVISKMSKQTIESHISQAIKAGAVDATPENSTFAHPPSQGNFVKPTLLTGVTHDMAIMKEETFGPVLPVMPVKDDAEAIRLINDSEFGLTASIWTKDLAKGEELAREVESGTVFVNRCDYPSPDLAWTGWKNSGKGVTLSKFGFDQFVKLKSIHLKLYPK